VTDSTFVYNTALFGGAIYKGADGGAGALTVTASTFSGNIGTDAGAAIANGLDEKASLGGTATVSAATDNM
jgi:predicted outer membrane repeat protein